MPINRSLLTEFPSVVFVETGSLHGDAIQDAVDFGYCDIRSIEIYEGRYKLCRRRFADKHNVKMYLGDSALILGDVIKDIDVPITFWLDAHLQGEGSPSGVLNVPLIAEIEHIKNHPIKTHTIMIDDVRCWWDYNSTHGLSMKDVFLKILEISPAYKFVFRDGFIPNDILVAYV